MMTLDSSANAIKQPTTKWLKDYQSPAFVISSVDMTVDLFDDKTIIKNSMHVIKNVNNQHHGTTANLYLDGEELIFISLKINNKPLASDAFDIHESGLTIHHFSQYLVNGSAQIVIENEIHPETNTALSGIYKSSGNFCSQCEAEGFRRITYFLDRPDVMSTYTVTITADKVKYPELLSNGNLISQDDIDDNRHRATWHDPHPKPSYLFALVAGQLAKIEDSFTTMSGRRVGLIIYTEPHNISQCDYAMGALKRSMVWDEKLYNREYDLDLYMIVAVDDFNAGAMENKGLNIFNTKYVLAMADTATDNDFIGVESVIAHEYFHNWSGNRVTCRDWFQLSLKEGFTVFRDQCFTADLHSAGVKRIEDVNILRNHQFKEDAGPMAHPIRPSSYQEINNFYTVTVYNKGAEIIRMIRHLIGQEAFHQGCELYFSRHDNNAVTCEDYIQAMADASGMDFSQFLNWYHQAGTPRVTVNETYDAANKTLTLSFEQTCAPTPGQDTKEPFVIPITFALFNEHGERITNTEHGDTLVLQQSQQSFVFHHIEEKPYVSLLRDFSAPIHLQRDIDHHYLSFLATNDDDEFNKWDALQTIYTTSILQIEKALSEKSALTTVSPTSLKQNFNHIYQLMNALFHDNSLNGLLKDKLLNIPSVSYLSELVEQVNPHTMCQARDIFIKNIALAFETELYQHYETLSNNKDYDLSSESIANRAIKNRYLQLIATLDNDASHQLCDKQLKNANNLTDRMAALQGVVNSNHPNRELIINEFQSQWQGEALIMDKWLSVQATSCHKDTLDNVKSLCHNKIFNEKNPNKVYALIRAFASNDQHFHEASGEGYRFIADWTIRLNDINPQIAARVASSFNSWKSYAPAYKALMKEQLERIQQHPTLSNNVAEIVGKALL